MKTVKMTNGEVNNSNSCAANSGVRRIATAIMTGTSAITVSIAKKIAENGATGLASVVEILRSRLRLASFDRSSESEMFTPGIE